MGFDNVNLGVPNRLSTAAHVNQGESKRASLASKDDTLNLSDEKPKISGHSERKNIDSSLMRNEFFNPQIEMLIRPIKRWAPMFT